MCSLDVMFATVRIRSRDCSMAVPMTSFAEGVHFGRFETSRFFVSRSMFVICRKSLFAAGALLLRRFRRCVAVFLAGAELWTCPFSFCVADAAL